jgi:hypothetical protein
MGYLLLDEERDENDKNLGYASEGGARRLYVESRIGSPDTPSALVDN